MVTPLFSHTSGKKRVVCEPPGIDEEQKGCHQPCRDAFQKNRLSLTMLEIFQLIVLRDSSTEMFSNWASCLSPWFAPEGTACWTKSSLTALRQGNSSHENVWTDNPKQISQYSENMLAPWTHLHNQPEPLVYSFSDCREAEDRLC